MSFYSSYDIFDGVFLVLPLRFQFLYDSVAIFVCLYVMGSRMWLAMSLAIFFSGTAHNVFLLLSLFQVCFNSFKLYYVVVDF